MSINFDTLKTNYPARLDDNVIRAVASITFLTAVLIQLRPELRFLTIPLFIDFTLRWFHPKLSPIARFNTIICQKYINKEPEMVWAPPKRFAMLIGMILTGFMSISYILQIPIVFQILLIFLLIASGLQAWYDFCLGCQMYDWLIQLGIFGRGQNAGSFLSYLEYMNGDAELSQNMSSSERIQSGPTSSDMIDRINDNKTTEESRKITENSI